MKSREVMVLNESLVSRCLFNPLSNTLREEMAEKMPIISEYKQGQIPIDNILKYIILVYDIQSPAQKEFKDYYQRKRECAKISSFPIDSNGRWTEEASLILIGQNEGVNKLVVKYISLLALPDYTQLILYLELLSRRSKDVFDGHDDDKTHIIIEKLSESIKRLTNEIFGSGEEDEIQRVRRSLYEQAEEDRVKIKPEDIIAMVNDGGLPSSWGYGDDYVVEKISYVGDTKPKEKHV